MPQMLDRLIQMLRIINYGPTLAELISRNIVSQVPITSDILQFTSITSGMTDWLHFSNLETIIRDGELYLEQKQKRNASNSEEHLPMKISGLNDQPNSLTSSRLANSEPVQQRSSNCVLTNDSVAINRNLVSQDSNDNDNDNDDDMMDELLTAFSSNQSDDGLRDIQLSSLISVMQVAQRLGIASMTPLGRTLLQGQLTEQNDRQDRRTRNTTENRPDSALRRAKKELQFHALLLAPHQIELIFVFCTLLSGRRKINIQQRFAELGLSSILMTMYDRMSWDAPPFTGNNPIEHIHGPGCDCNPESAVRVQFLRLIHNFYDRDFLGNYNKMLMLSKNEIQLIQKYKNITTNTYTIDKTMFQTMPTELEKGLIRRIAETLAKEPIDSVYRFWLSACIENFLRGCGQIGQIFMAQVGVLSCTMQHIIELVPSPLSTLQTSFDLLGELVKCNRVVLEMIDNYLDEEKFVIFTSKMMNNLVDSNVFVRSLYLSFELLFPNSCAGGCVDIIKVNDESTIRMDNLIDSLTPQQRQKMLDCYGFYVDSLICCNSKEDQSTLASINDNSMKTEFLPTDNVHYLVDTWIQVAPKPLSPRAISIYQDKETVDQYLSSFLSQKNGKITNSSIELKDNRDASNHSYLPVSEFNTSTNKNHTERKDTSLSQFGSGVYGALKDIHAATTHFLNFKSDPGKATDNNLSLAVNRSLKIDHDTNTDLEGEEFYTPPEQPRFVRPMTSVVPSSATATATATMNKSAGDSSSTKSYSAMYGEPNIFTSADVLVPEPAKAEKVVDRYSNSYNNSKSDSQKTMLYDTKTYFVSSNENNSKYDNIDNSRHSITDTIDNSETSKYIDCRNNIEESATPMNQTKSNNDHISDRNSQSVHDNNSDRTMSNSTLSRVEFVPQILDKKLEEFDVSYVSLPLKKMRDFLTREKISVLVRLMSTVILRSVNHENICCLNTTLLILLLEYRR